MIFFVLKKLYKYYIEKYFLKILSNIRKALLSISDNGIFISTVYDQKVCACIMEGNREWKGNGYACIGNMKKLFQFAADLSQTTMTMVSLVSLSEMQDDDKKTYLNPIIFCIFLFFLFLTIK